jgi:hypothetical protein
LTLRKILYVDIDTTLVDSFIGTVIAPALGAICHPAVRGAG